MIKTDHRFYKYEILFFHSQLNRMRPLASIFSPSTSSYLTNSLTAIAFSTHPKGLNHDSTQNSKRNCHIYDQYFGYWIHPLSVEASSYG